MKSLNLKPSACSEDYSGKPNSLHTRRTCVSARAVTDTQSDYSNPRACAER